MKTSAGTFIKGFLGLAVGAVCLWLAFRGVSATEQDTGVSLHDVVARIVSVPLWAHVAFVALMVLQFILRTERWRVQVRGLTSKKPGARESLAINAVAFAAVFLMPFRLGELVRPNLSASRGIMRASAGMAATVLERAVDGIVTTGFFGAVLLVMRDRAVPAYVQVGGWTALVVFGGAILFLVVAYVARSRVVPLFSRVASILGQRIATRATSILEGFLDGLACFRRPADVAAYLSLTVAYWMLNVLSLYVLMLGMSLDVPPSAGVFCLCFLVMGMMMPAPPGNVGNFHAFARAALTVFAVPGVAAVAYAVLLHAATVVVIAAWALVFFISGDLTFGSVRHAALDDDGDKPEAPR